MNILMELAKNFPSYFISSQEPPTYVNAHWMDKNKPIILIYKKGQSFDNTVTTPRKRDLQQTTLISEFELTGSPLRVDMTYDKLEETFLLDASQCWHKEEIQHEGVSVKEACNILNFYNKLIRDLSAEERVPLWIVCDGKDKQNTLLMAALSSSKHFNRGMVVHMDMSTANSLSVDAMKDMHWKTYGCSKEDPLTCRVLGTFRLSGKRISSQQLSGVEEVFNKHYTGMSQLECEWSQQTLSVPIHDVNISLVQEAIIGHNLSIGTLLWKSVCSLQGVSSAIISFASTVMNVNLEDISIRPFTTVWENPSIEELEMKIKLLLKEVEEYSSLSWEPSAGCICITDDTTSIQQLFKHMSSSGSSNDFTFKLWDILRDCDTVKDLVTLLVYTLKEIYKRNLRPFVDPSNTTVLGVLVKKLSRGSSQAAVNSLSSLFTTPTRALGLVGQLGLHKICWEYTQIFTLIDATLGFNDRLRLQNKVSEVYEEVYNQTIMDMSLGTGDLSMNPFDSKCNLMDSTFMQDVESTVNQPLADLTLDDFASLKKHNINVNSGQKIPEKEQPLFSDDMNVDISSKEWKFKLTRLAQLHTCLEHAYRAQQSLNCDFNTLKPILVHLLEHYTSEESPIKTVGQLRHEPVQSFTHNLPYKAVKDHLHFKHATTYKVCFTSTKEFNKSKEVIDAAGEAKSPKEPRQVISSVFVCSQQPVFPPSIYSPKDVPEEIDSLFYHCSRYLYISNAY